MRTTFAALVPLVAAALGSGATLELPAGYFRLLEAGSKQVRERLAGDPAADLER